MKKQTRTIDRDYLRRVKASTPEQRLNWLADARDFAEAAKKENKKNNAK